MKELGKLRNWRRVAASAAVVAPALFGARDAHALDAFLDVPAPAVAEATAAYRYANMSDDVAVAELDRRHILYSKVDAASAPGVRAPVRLTGRLHGVNFHSSLPPDQRVTSPFEILDARLALALDDFAAILEHHDIDEVVHFTMYRPAAGVAPTTAAGAPSSSHVAAAAKPSVAVREDHGRVDEPIFEVVPRARATGKAHVAPAKPAAQKSAARPAAASASGPAAKLKETHELKQKSSADDAKPAQIIGAPRGAATKATAWKPRGPVASLPAPRPETGAAQRTASPAAPGTRHPAGLAIDVGVLHKKDGRWISVGASFHGHIGDKTCGEGAKSPDDSNARELRSIVCEARDLGVFTYVLTPNYNAAHVDHFHMEIKPGVRWFLYH